MKKLIVLVLLVFVVCGCGVTQKATGSDGSDGSNGSNGNDGRDFITPTVRPYTFSYPNEVLMFTDCATVTEPKLSEIGMGNQVSGNNYLAIKVPAGLIGKKIQVVINGTIAEMVIPSNIADTIVFQTGIGTDYAWGKYLNCSKIDRKNKNSYIVWYFDGTQKEMYFSDTWGDE